MKGAIQLASCAVFFGLAGCASAPSSPESNDPFEGLNRSIFQLNQHLDRGIARPIAVFYQHAVPSPARAGVHNVIANLKVPTTLANDVMQGDIDRASQSLGNFAINSSLGLAGILDVAGDWGIPRHANDFGQTLAIYGVDEGPFLMLPIIGPDNPRDLTGQIVDIFLDPLTYLHFQGDIYWSGAHIVMNGIDLRSRNIKEIDSIEESSVDLYATVRSLYRQHRKEQIRKGKPQVDDLPDL